MAVKVRGARISLIPDEFLFPSSVVVLESGAALDADRVKACSRSGGRRRPAQGRTPGPARDLATRPSMRPGRYALSVDLELGDDEVNRPPISFSFVRSRARVPADVAVESFVRLEVTGTSTRRLPAFGEASGRS